MKKFYDTNGLLFVLLVTSLSLFSCTNDNENLPKGYVGFEKPTRTVEYDKDQSEIDLQIKIIATDKSKEDRTVVIAIPAPPQGQAPVMKLTEEKVIIKAKQKSAVTTAKLYPKRMVLQQQYITLTCVPQWEEASSSKLTLLLKKK